MKNKYTFVVEFDEGKEPKIFSNQGVLGGKLVAAAFFDYRDDMFSEAEKDSLEQVIYDAEDSDAWEEHEVDSDEIIRKLRLLVM